MYKFKKPIDMRKKKSTPVKKSHYPLKYVPKQLYFRLMIDVYASNLTFIFLEPWKTHAGFFFQFGDGYICISADKVSKNSCMYNLATPG